MRHLPLGVVSGDGVRDLLFSHLAKASDDPIRVLLGPSLVVCIVKKSGGSPFVFVLAVLGGESAHDDFDAAGVPEEAVALGHFCQKGGGGFAVHVGTA